MAFMVTIESQVSRTSKAYCMKGETLYPPLTWTTRKKSCGRALNKRLLEEDLTDLVQRGSSPASGLLENKSCEGGLY